MPLVNIIPGFYMDSVTGQSTTNNSIELSSNKSTVKIEPIDLDVCDKSAIVKTTNNSSTGTKESITYLCHRCRTVFSSRALFELHYKQAYNEKPIYTCQICDKQMKNKRSYQRHYNRHGTLQKFACPACPKMFSQEKILKRHEAIHHMSPAKVCTDCNEQFVDLIKFKAHRRTHAQPTATKRTYKCDDCGKVMKNRSSLSVHLKIHSNDRQYGCAICDQKFVQKINLINHVKAHNATKTFSCSECGKSFVNQAQLLRHNAQHTNVRSFVCETCKKTYKTKRDLRLHSMVHEVQRPHKCPECNKTFLSTSKLKQHLNIHSGARPFKCQHCPKDFTNFPNWLKHTRRRHKVDHKTGEKLIAMPNFLKKTGTKSTKTPSKPKQLQSEPIAKVTSGQSSAAIVATNSFDSSLVKHEKPLDIDYIEMDDFHEPTNGDMVASTQLTDLSTITVNNRTLPLNTLDDLERAASLLMQPQLDLDDDILFGNIKSETLAYELDHFQDLEHLDPNLALEVGTIPFTDANDLCQGIMYSYCPPETQCDLTMMPLPPINTDKTKRNCGADASASIIPSEYFIRRHKEKLDQL